jgi:hypothetical protein
MPSRACPTEFIMGHAHSHSSFSPWGELTINDEDDDNDDFTDSMKTDPKFVIIMLER